MTKRQLRRLIREEYRKTLKERRMSDWEEQLLDVSSPKDMEKLITNMWNSDAESEFFRVFNILSRNNSKIYDVMYKSLQLTLKKHPETFKHH